MDVNGGGVEEELLDVPHVAGGAHEQDGGDQSGE